MRGASLADLHLGFRAYTALEGGRNAREVDVEVALEEATVQILGASVDVVTVAGDIFHHPRVSDYAKKAFLDFVLALMEAGIPVVILQGNHDAGKTADVLTPIMLAEGFWAHAHVVTEPKRIRLLVDGGVASIACFPYVARGDGASYRLDPDPDADVNVLVMHAAVKGSADGDKLPHFYGSEAQALDIGRQADRWDIIAVGDYHEHTILHESGRAFYSGSIERTSTNIWDEHQPKGWVLWDTDAGTTEFQEVVTRPMIDYDLGDFDFLPGVGAKEVNHCLRHIAEGSVDDSIVRLKVEAFPRDERDSIDWKLVRDLKRTCLHFELDVRYSQGEATVRFERGAEGAKASLRTVAEEFLADDPEDVRDLALAYLDTAEDL